MQVTETQAEGLKREYRVVVGSDDIDQKVQGRLKEIAQSAQIPGFRPGKAPMSILRQRYGQAVLGEVLEKAVNETSQQALQEKDLRPAEQPRIEVESFDQGQDLVYKISLELLPEIQPMDFSEIELERIKVAVPEEEIDNALKQMASQVAESEPIEEERPAETGDIAVIDFTGTVDGEAYPGMEANGHHLELGSGSLIPGFEDQVVGMKVGETREVRVTFPSDYNNTDLAGREAVFQVTLQEIRAKKEQEIDDALAERVGAENVEDLRNKARESLQGQYDQAARTQVKRKLLDVLADNHSFDLPPSMVESEFEQIWQQIQQDREQGRLDAEDSQKSDEDLKGEYRGIAERRVRLGLLLSEVGRQNNIEVSQDELQKALIDEVQRYPGQEQEVLQYYQQNENALAALRGPVFEEKVIDYILELGNVSEREVSPEEFRDLLSEEQGAEDKAAE
jgi:trigger factor